MNSFYGFSKGKTGGFNQKDACNVSKGGTAKPSPRRDSATIAGTHARTFAGALNERQKGNTRGRIRGQTCPGGENGSPALERTVISVRKLFRPLTLFHLVCEALLNLSPRQAVLEIGVALLDVFLEAPHPRPHAFAHKFKHVL